MNGNGNGNGDVHEVEVFGIARGRMEDEFVVFDSATCC